MPSSKISKKYFTINPDDQIWGLAINSVGYQSIAENEVYPPNEHPTRYLFNTKTGRILNEYSILYISKGKGIFKSKSSGTHNLTEGSMFILFPGEWHTYMPDTSTGWNEYWISFNGKIMDEWVKNGFFTQESPIFTIGPNEDVISLYKKAIMIAKAEEANYQQALAGLVCNLAGMAIYLSRNIDFKESEVASQINLAKIAVHDRLSTISPTELADVTCMSYSKFRKIFKDYTGLSPSRYILQVRINHAKELLTNTTKSIKEIAFELGYENSDYFFIVFKKVTGVTPLAYRNYTQGKELWH